MSLSGMLNLDVESTDEYFSDEIVLLIESSSLSTQDPCNVCIAIEIIQSDEFQALIDMLDEDDII